MYNGSREMTDSRCYEVLNCKSIRKSIKCSQTYSLPIWPAATVISSYSQAADANLEIPNLGDNPLEVYNLVKGVLDMNLECLGRWLVYGHFD